MKILFCGYRNPDFRTITEYTYQALAASGSDVSFFEDRDFLLPAVVREAVPFLAEMDLRGINARLVRKAGLSRPELVFVCGGYRILPSALKRLREMGIKTVLWTIDAPADTFKALVNAAPFYDHVFCGGSEAIEIFRDAGITNAVWLPFACDSDVHKKQELSEAERRELGCDICFVGTVAPGLYPERVRFLESISDLDLKVWGPGAETLSPASPLRRRLAAGKTPPELWTKIYSAAKIVMCAHYSSPYGKYPCCQASPRVYEAMACGAFLMCDAQKDVLALFEDGRHLAIFRNAGELREKIGYYLANPEKREAIALAGREEVIRNHTYKLRMAEVLRRVRENGK